MVNMRNVQFDFGGGGGGDVGVDVGGDVDVDGCGELMLSSRWVLWETKCSTTEYVSSLCKVGEIESVEKFWMYYNNYPSPSMIFYNGEYKPTVKNPMRNISSIGLFREGVKPEWEDEANIRGGELALRVFSSMEEIDQKWEMLSCGVVGEQFEGLGVTGVRVVDSSVPKRNSLYRIEVWFSDCRMKSGVERVFREILGLGGGVDLFYREHSSAVDTGMYRSNHRKGRNFRR